jgi:hypothetical protein
MAGSPERLKPRHIAVQGLRILLPHMVDELRLNVANRSREVNLECSRFIVALGQAA